MQDTTMKVPGRLTRLLGVAAALGLVAALLPHISAHAADSKQTNSAKLAKPLKEAQEDIKAKKYSEAIAKLKAAEGIEGKTAYDQHLINDFLGFCYYKTNDLPDAAKAFEAEVDDGFLTGPDVQQKTKAASEIEYQGKNYDKAIEYGNRAIKGGYGNAEIQTIVAQSYYLKGDMKNTAKFEEPIIDNEIKSGETPKSESLMLVYSACQKLNDKSCEDHTLERLVTYYPKPEYWAQLLFGLRQQTSSNDANLFQTYRLMNEVDVLKDPGDYTEMAQIALDQGSPGDAVQVLQKAFDKNVFTDQRIRDKNQRLLERAKQQAASDQASLPKAEKDAAAAATGAKNIGVGKAYLGYGQYDKAADQFSKGLAKGGVTNTALAQLDLGIAQFKGGHKDDAIKSFKAVKGDPVLERLAALWVLHAHQGAAASTAAAAPRHAAHHRHA